MSEEAVIEQPTEQPAAAPAAPAEPAAPSALAKPVPLHDLIPEKFRVKNGEDFDADASTRKVLESYQAMEKRLGSGDVPPKSAEEYQITVPDALKESFQEDERTAAFRKDAHEAGLNQKQFDFVMDRFFKVGPELAGAAVQGRVDQTVSNLEKAWGDKYDAEFNGAFKAFNQLAGDDLKGKFDEIMTNPSIAYQVLARIGKEMQEPGSIPALAEAGSGESVEEMIRSEAYHNTKHPDHAKVSAKVRAFYEKKYGTAAVS